MKKLLFVIAAVAAVFTSCDKNLYNIDAKDSSNADTPELIKMSFTADASFTRTVLNGDRSVSFSENDAIAVFANGNRYKFTTVSGGASATFEGTAESASTYYAIFPYSDGLSIDDNVIQGVNLSKSSVKTVPGTYNAQQAIFVAKTTSSSLSFKPVCALLKFTVPAGVEDLKEVNIFNRNTALSGAITGTFDVTVTDGTPAISVTAKNGGESDPHTAGAVPNGKTYFSAGTYYMPVLPVSLTQGLDFKLSFNGFTGRAFNTSALSLEAGQVYNLGTIAKSDHFTFDGFETNTISYYSGNDNALSIVDNPLSTDINSSAKVLKNDMQTSNWPTSGYVNTNADYAPLFPSSVRQFFTTLSVKMYWGSDQYYPHMLFNKTGTAQLPARLNGVAIDSQDTWDTTVRTDDWNVLEWDASQFSKTNFSTLSSFQFRCFVTYSNSTTTCDNTNYHHLIYLDEITIIQ